uniref:Pro-corazonin n=1 Tax=Ampulex compressa TaxID=860918 RepID=A0A1W6EVR9_AMPCP|nr:preprocorazonin [Ampulex compressa]
MMAATRSLLALLLLLSVLSCALCQTFQYSRGWRPGKRSVRSRQPEDLLEVVRANLKDASIADADKQLEQCASIVRNLLEYGAAPKAQELLLSCEALFEGDNSAGGAARFLQ